MSGHLKTTNRQALLLFIQEFRKERKTLGFGKQMDHSVHLALQHRTFDLLDQFDQTDIVVVHGGAPPSLGKAHYLPERGGDFNARFINALGDTFALGYDRVVAVGGDIPTLHADDISTALTSNDLVIGPTHDGGFYLAALGRDDIALFDQLPWRQTCLLNRLSERLHRQRRSCQLLEKRQDVDHAADARRKAGMLMKLVRQWLKHSSQVKTFPTIQVLSLRDRIPEPRYHSLPPPQLAA